MRTKSICSLSGCERPHSSHGYCAAHAERFRKFGFVSSAPIRRSGHGKTIAARFWGYVVPTDGCWNWQGYIGRNGYGYFYTPTTPSAHRTAYCLIYGAIPPGLSIDHLCFNKQCVRPDHLEAVTQRTNTLRAVTPWSLNAVKTHCPQGHAYDATNTYTYRGMRQCRICRTARDRARRRRSR